MGSMGNYFHYLSLLLLIIFTKGESIPITNAGFEEDDATLVPNSNSNPDELIGWNIYDPLGVNRGDSPGISRPGACDGCASNQGVSFNDPIYEDSAPEGNTCLYMWAGDRNAGAFGVEQELLSTFEPLTSYILSVKVGNQGANCWIRWNGGTVNWCDGCNGFSGYVVELLADNIIVAQDDNSIFIADQEWQTITVNYTTSSADDIAIGKALKIRLLQKNDASATSRCLMFDDVVLTVNTAVTSTTSTALPTTASPTTALPTTALPTTALPTTALPTTALPTTALPTTASPTTALPTTALPTAALPTTKPTIDPSVSITTAKSTKSPTSALPTATTLTVLPSTKFPTVVLNSTLSEVSMPPSTTYKLPHDTTSPPSWSYPTSITVQIESSTDTTANLFGNKWILIGAIFASCAGLLLICSVICYICIVCRRNDKRNQAYAANHNAVNIEAVASLSGTPKTIRIHTEEPMLRMTGTNTHAVCVNEDSLVDTDEELCIPSAAGLPIPHSSSDEHVLPSGNVTIGGPGSEGAIISAAGDELIATQAVPATDSESEYVPPAPLSPNQYEQESNVMISDPFTTSPRAGERI